VSRREKVIAVDLGTTYFKVCRFDFDGRIEATCSLPAPVVRTHPRDEITIQDFRQHLTHAIRSVTTENTTRENIAAITFATQANSFALLDDQDEPLTPFVLWSDLRAKHSDFPLSEFSSCSAYRDRTGVARLNHLFMPAKLHWFRQFAPNTLAKTHRLALLSDYFTWWLTGIWCTEAATAALSGLVDIRTLTWWPQACVVAEVAPEWLSRIARSGTDIGQILPDVAVELNLPHHCRFFVGCLDQHAGAIGAGNVYPGDVSETTGTVLATVRCAQSFGLGLAQEVFQGPAFREGLFYQMVFSEQSAGLLERYRKEVAKGMTFPELDKLAELTPPGARGLRLRPDAFHHDASRMFENKRGFHSRGDEVRAILEGVAAELSRQIQLLCGGELPAVVHASGGAARSRLWLEIKSRTVGIPVVAVSCPEPTSLGAALLAISACRQIPPEDLIRDLGWQRHSS